MRYCLRAKGVLRQPFQNMHTFSQQFNLRGRKQRLFGSLLLIVETTLNILLHRYNIAENIGIIAFLICLHSLQGTISSAVSPPYLCHFGRSNHQLFYEYFRHFHLLHYQTQFMSRVSCNSVCFMTKINNFLFCRFTSWF